MVGATNGTWSSYQFYAQTLCLYVTVGMRRETPSYLFEKVFYRLRRSVIVTCDGACPRVGAAVGFSTGEFVGPSSRPQPTLASIVTELPSRVRGGAAIEIWRRRS